MDAVLALVNKSRKVDLTRGRYGDHMISDLPSSRTFSFPWKLHQLLEDVESEGDADIVSWVSTGNAFRVHRRAEFVQRILPVYFKQKSLKSFQRQLYIYGFGRIRSGPDKGSYYHPLFIREHRHSTDAIERVRTTKNDQPSRSKKTSVSTKKDATISSHRTVLRSSSLPCRSSPAALLGNRNQHGDALRTSAGAGTTNRGTTTQLGLIQEAGRPQFNISPTLANTMMMDGRQIGQLRPDLLFGLQERQQYLQDSSLLSSSRTSSGAGGPFLPNVHGMSPNKSLNPAVPSVINCNFPTQVWNGNHIRSQSFPQRTLCDPQQQLSGLQQGGQQGHQYGTSLFTSLENNQVMEQYGQDSVTGGPSSLAMIGASQNLQNIGTGLPSWSAAGGGTGGSAPMQRRFSCPGVVAPSARQEVVPVLQGEEPAELSYPLEMGSGSFPWDQETESEESSISSPTPTIDHDDSSFGMALEEDWLTSIERHLFADESKDT